MPHRTFRTRHSLRPLLLAAAIAGCLAATPALAQSAAPTAQVAIQAGPLASALDALGEQTGALIMYEPDLVRGLSAPALSGEVSAAEGLRRLLQGSGLEAEAVNATTFVLRRAAAAPAPAPRQAPAAASAADDEPVDLQDVVVVGSRLGASEYESAQPVVLITSEDIERSGAATVAQVLSTRPEVSVSNNGDAIGTSGDFNASTVQLRGLPRGTTLVLVNGRRIGNTGVQSALDFFDLNTLPLSLVERIEILPVGSSAVYGGDALAGVVNIVLKKDAQGLDVTLRRGYARGYGENQYTVTWGGAWERGSMTAALTYSRNSGLDESERDITADKDYTRFGGSDNRSLLTNPGNVFSLEGCPPAPSSCFFVKRDQRGNLPGLDSPYAGVPTGSTGVGLTPDDFAGTAGILNFASQHYPIFIPAERYALLLDGTFHLTDTADLFAEVTMSRNKIHRAGTPVLLNGENGSYVVSADNPYNPFGVDVGIDFALPGRPDSTLSSDYVRALVGARGTLKRWDWEVAGWQSRNTADQLNFFNTSQAIRDALASSDPETALNPFMDGPGGSPELIASLFSDSVVPFITNLRGVNGFLRGPVMALPGGDLTMLVGGEWERQSLESTGILNGAVTAGARTTRALFTELRAPLLAGREGTGVKSLLTATAALRADRDSSFEGTGTTRALGLELRPWKSLLLRGSYNTAFKPPVLYQAVTPPRYFNTTVSDPKMGGARVPIQYISASGVSETINPERGRSTTLGIVYSPQSLPVNFTLTHWKNDIRDRIGSVALQYMVDNEEDFPGRITRDADGNIVLVDARPVNINFVNTAGVDLGFDGHFKTGFGTWFPAVAATYTYRYQTQVRPGDDIVDGVAKAAAAGWAPRWKGTLQLGLQREHLYTQITGRYVGQYRDYSPLTSGPNAGTYNQLGDLWYVDLAVNYAIGERLAKWWPSLRNTSLGLSANNLFDRGPQFSILSGNGYDASQYDIRGRYVSAQLKFTF